MNNVIENILSTLKDGFTVSFRYEKELECYFIRVVKNELTNEYRLSEFEVHYVTDKNELINYIINNLKKEIKERRKEK